MADKEYYDQLYDELYHHGILGQKWGVRRFQNEDGSLTEEGRRRYGKESPLTLGEEVRLAKNAYDINRSFYKTSKTEKIDLDIKKLNSVIRKSTKDRVIDICNKIEKEKDSDKLEKLYKEKEEAIKLLVEEAIGVVDGIVNSPRRFKKVYNTGVAVIQTLLSEDSGNRPSDILYDDYGSRPERKDILFSGEKKFEEKFLNSKHGQKQMDVAKKILSKYYPDIKNQDEFITMFMLRDGSGRNA